ncbi:MAG: hypothetical protein ACRCXM_13295 [Beijerinckiaceae bacterium]
MSQHGNDTQAARTLAWLIVFNKPFYPLYLYWFIDLPLGQTWPTLLTMPLFAALPVLSLRSASWLRFGIPVLGLLDTIMTEKLFGSGSGVIMFVVPCLLILAYVSHAAEMFFILAFSAASFVTVTVLHGRMGPALVTLTSEQIATLYSINLYSVAALCFFIVWRFSASRHSIP